LHLRHLLNIVLLFSLAEVVLVKCFVHELAHELVTSPAHYLKLLHFIVAPASFLAAFTPLESLRCSVACAAWPLLVFTAYHTPSAADARSQRPSLCCTLLKAALRGKPKPAPQP
jgi:hypothetical protein